VADIVRHSPWRSARVMLATLSARANLTCDGSASLALRRHTIDVPITQARSAWLLLSNSVWAKRVR
jgi:hypothetical protein